MRSRTQMWGLLVALVVTCGGCGSTGSTGATAGPDPAAVRAVFVKGVDDFCRAYYLDQKAADVRYPSDALIADFDRQVAGAARRDDSLLEGLHPLPVMVPLYHRFVRNEQSLLSGLEQGESGVDAVGAALDRRHRMGLELGASECDGLLPPGQRRAAVAAVRHYERNRDPHQACVALVSPEFTRSQFPSLADCLRHFEAQYSGLYPQPTGIRVSQVTGVDNLQASVYFTEVPDCGCGELKVRLYLEHGRWLVRSGSEVPTQSL